MLGALMPSNSTVGTRSGDRDVLLACHAATHQAEVVDKAVPGVVVDMGDDLILRDRAVMEDPNEPIEPDHLLLDVQLPVLGNRRGSCREAPERPDTHKGHFGIRFIVTEASLQQLLCDSEVPFDLGGTDVGVMGILGLAGNFGHRNLLGSRRMLE